MERDYGADAQLAAEAHLGACMDAYWAAEDGTEAVSLPDMLAPFDGCNTCVVREVLSAAWHIVDAYIDDAFEGGEGLIAVERRRQISDEGWTLKHDDEHHKGELVAAAIAYSYVARCQVIGADLGRVPSAWPWDESWWKPSDDPIRNLVKAGALIAAEIDRLTRAR